MNIVFCARNARSVATVECVLERIERHTHTHTIIGLCTSEFIIYARRNLRHNSYEMKCSSVSSSSIACARSMLRLHVGLLDLSVWSRCVHRIHIHMAWTVSAPCTCTRCKFNNCKILLSFSLYLGIGVFRVRKTKVCSTFDCHILSLVQCKFKWAIVKCALLVRQRHRRNPDDGKG